MYKKILPFLIFSLCQLTGFSQTEKYIKVVGNAIETVTADGIQVKLQLQELKRDEYQKIREKSFDEIKTELAANLKTLNLSLANLKDVWPPQTNYNNQKYEQYYITVATKEQAKAIANFAIKGYKAIEFSYSFPQNAKIDIDKLYQSCLKDAKRKAGALATKAGKKVGQILNIEATSYENFTIPQRQNTKEYTFKYSITLTYELLD